MQQWEYLILGPCNKCDAVMYVSVLHTGHYGDWWLSASILF